LHPRLEAFERSIVYCVPHGGSIDDSGFTLAGQNLFLSRKTGVSFTTTWRNEHWNAGAPKKPAQAVAAALVEQMGLIACFFRHAARHRGPNVIRSASWEIYQSADQSIRRGQNAQIDRHMSNT
jgi:hypothetical protein